MEYSCFDTTNAALLFSNAHKSLDMSVLLDFESPHYWATLLIDRVLNSTLSSIVKD